MGGTVLARVVVSVVLASLFTYHASAAQPASRNVEDLPPGQGYDFVLGVWRHGNEHLADVFATKLLKRYPDHQRLAFFRAACVHTGYHIEETTAMMRAAAAIDPDSTEGVAARALVEIDLKRDVSRNLAKLRSLIDSHPDKPLLQYLMVVECAALKLNDEGVRHCEALLGRLNDAPGPVSLHRLYADLLEASGRGEGALAERRTVVEMQPDDWSYQLLGSTLMHLKRFEEADGAFRKSVEKSPRRASNWLSWALSLQKWGKLDDAIAKARRATELDPGRFVAWNLWALCLEQKRDPSAALEKYRAAIKAEPRDIWAYARAERILRQLGRGPEADAVLQEWKRIAAPSKTARAATE
jgi:tetratricopeptide (TPR) repeat protein